MVSIQSLSNIWSEASAFFVPGRKTSANRESVSQKYTAVLIPTYKPTTGTYDLVESLLNWHPNILVVLIDDCTPLTDSYLKLLDKIRRLELLHDRIIYLRTPKNSLKASALNYGISYLMSFTHKPQVIVTMDDDVKINEKTIPLVLKTLFSENNIGAACSMARVTNKNKNLLTRLQSLEYHSFNVTKIADNGFLKGPLVMQGMLTAFRLSALQQVKGYTENHLIEDYDMTAKLKRKGWKVKINKDAVAWTHVPETIEDLWKQRVRWTSGGLRVLSEYWKNVPAIYQDIFGHSLFLGIFSLIILSFVFTKTDAGFSPLTITLLVLATLNFLLAFSFNVMLLRSYPNIDKKDVLIRLALLPELIYCNILSLILIGSYLFFAYYLFTKHVILKIALMQKPTYWGLSAFQKVGFSLSWGTRETE